MTNTQPFAAVTNLSSSNISDGIRPNFDLYSPSTLNAEHQVAHGAMLIKCPIVMCAPHHDAVSALEAITYSRLNMTNISNGEIMVFNHKLGPFPSALVTMFNPPNPYLNHFSNVYGQIESIVSTALVQCASLDIGIEDLDYVRRKFEEKIDNIVFEKRATGDEIRFMTCSPTSSGWYILLSAKRLASGVFFQMNIFRKRQTDAKSSIPLSVDVDI